MENSESYSQYHNKPPFDWNEFLEKEHISFLEWEKASILAQSWITCACGNQCSIIPRAIGGEPIDLILSQLGSTFYTHIKNQERFWAKRILKQIENRSFFLIEEIKNKP